MFSARVVYRWGKLRLCEQASGPPGNGRLAQLLVAPWTPNLGVFPFAGDCHRPSGWSPLPGTVVPQQGQPPWGQCDLVSSSRRGRGAEGFAEYPHCVLQDLEPGLREGWTFSRETAACWPIHDPWRVGVHSWEEYDRPQPGLPIRPFMHLSDCAGL